ncbi:MAG: TetR/AcrR family transcriptional regulator, partial [Tumebacillaceae bacterium]
MVEQALTKETILDMAEQVLRRFGTDKTTVVDVARALNVSHGTIYRHFPSKASLREAVAERWLHSVSTPLASVFEHPSDATTRLRLWFDTLM